MIWYYYEAELAVREWLGVNILRVCMSALLLAERWLGCWYNIPGLHTPHVYRTGDTMWVTNSRGEHSTGWVVDYE